MFKFIKMLLVVLTALSPVTIFAHPGHGNHNAQSILHYIATPTHLLPLILVVGFVVFILVKRSLNKSEQKIED